MLTTAWILIWQLVSLTFLNLKSPMQKRIVESIKAVVNSWHSVAKKIGLSKDEINRMAPAFTI